MMHAILGFKSLLSSFICKFAWSFLEIFLVLSNRMFLLPYPLRESFWLAVSVANTQYCRREVVVQNDDNGFLSRISASD
jgi:hypothetical protein